MDIKCARGARGDACPNPPVMGAVAISPDDSGEGTLYEMFASCVDHEEEFLALGAAVPEEKYVLIRFKEEER